jgi:hypothetical protein
MSKRLESLYPLSSDKLSLIQASELSQYSFCRRAWWLGAVKKIAPANQTALVRGRQVHTRHQRGVQAVEHWRRGGFLLLGLGSLFFIVIILNSCYGFWG